MKNLDARVSWSNVICVKSSPVLLVVRLTTSLVQDVSLDIVKNAFLMASLVINVSSVMISF